MQRACCLHRRLSAAHRGPSTHRFTWRLHLLLLPTVFGTSFVCPKLSVQEPHYFSHGQLKNKFTRTWEPVYNRCVCGVRRRTQASCVCSAGLGFLGLTPHPPPRSRSVFLVSRALERILAGGPLRTCTHSVLGWAPSDSLGAGPACLGLSFLLGATTVLATLIPRPLRVRTPQ